MLHKTELDKRLQEDMEAVRPVDNIQAFAWDVQRRALTKKLPHASGETRRAALSAFVDRNQAVRQFCLTDVSCEHAQDVFRSARAFLRHVLGQEHYAPDPANGRFGPGDAFGVPGSDMVAKYTTISYSTSYALGFFARAHPVSLPSQRSAVAEMLKGAKAVSAAKLTTVPKDDTIDRVIAIEPSANMFLQQAVRWDLERCLASLGLPIDYQQDDQRKLARIGSLDDTLSTIDLTAASDSISTGLVEFLFREDLVWWLHQARSGTVLVDGEPIHLNLMSTMGNATTFPLQTLLYFGLVRGVYRLRGIPVITSGPNQNVGVFGDDIICLSECYDDVVKVLSFAGFTPNLSKSFKSGGFKESCGHDYYYGTNVRPVYIKDLSCEAACYSAYNRIHMWGRKHNCPLPRTLSYVYRIAAQFASKQRRKVLYVPWGEAVDSGIQAWINGRYTALRPVKSAVKGTFDDDRQIWLAIGGYAESTDDGWTVGRRPRYTRYRVERCFCAHPVVSAPLVLNAINKRFGLGHSLSDKRGGS